MSGEPEYSFGDRLLHRLALGFPFVSEAALDLEISRFASASPEWEQRKHVFVAGLARAGTTLLMRMLYGTGDFCSLTYRDMPFVLAPNTWAGLSGRSQKQARSKERAHGDGVMVDFDSPEALEEVFWRVACGDQYIRNDALVPMQADEDTTDRFRKYVDVVLHRYKGLRYLSKNNNNILRISSINHAFPDALVIIPYRDPVQHAHSLLKQHIQFVERQKGDPFVRQYMDWLGHHEFGAGHKPFLFGPANDNAPGDLGCIEYWLELWVGTYRYLLNDMRGNRIRAVFSSYELFCKNPAELQEIVREPNDRSEAESSYLPSQASVTPNLVVRDRQLLKNAMELHQELLEFQQSNTTQGRRSS